MKNKIILLGVLGTLSLVGCSRLLKINADAAVYVEFSNGIKVDMTIDPYYESFISINETSTYDSISVEAGDNFVIKGLSEDFVPDVYENIVNNGVIVESYHKLDFKFNYADGVFSNESKLEEAEGTKYYLFAFTSYEKELRYSFTLSIGEKDSLDEISASLMEIINNAKDVEIKTYSTNFDKETNSLVFKDYLIKLENQDKIDAFKNSLSDYDKINPFSRFLVVPGERVFEITIRDETGSVAHFKYYHLDKIIYKGSIVGAILHNFVDFVDMLIESQDEVVNIQEHVLVP